ncbi:MAG: glutamate--tRNA ligase [Candidatus Diapherotrites archaeon]|nr:glutamate--tRNA ligase [Candidatus Diapherotrites archaeon]
MNDLLVLKHVLKNELEHGEASVSVVMNKVMGEAPELRSKAKEVVQAIRKTIEESSCWSAEEKKEKLLQLWPDALEKKEEEKKVLRELRNAFKGRVVVRFAPNPNGPPTLGSSRGIVINSEYAKMYDGTFLCRFDDTDPDKKRPMLEAYEWCLEDMEWLGARPGRVIIMSDRMEQYYSYAEELIERGACYVCSCDAETFRDLRTKGKPCPHRKQSKKETLELWRKMLNSEVHAGEAVLKIRTDMKHKDPAIRDWTCFRIVERQHPKAPQYSVWPMLDFAGAIEDHDQQVTHIIRGKDLRDSTERQKYLYEYMKWKYPETYYWGRVALHDFGKLSTSGMAREIKEGIYAGWDDPRLPTLRALRRRGFFAQALREFWLGFGLSEKDVQASMENLEACNRKYAENCNRLFFVPDPKPITITEVPPTTVHLKNHPDHPERGFREYKLEGQVEVLVPEEEGYFRLKDAFNVREGKYAGTHVMDVPKMQWVLPEKSIACDVVMPDGTRVQGKAEDTLEKSHEGDVLQFERFGFVRVDEKKLGHVTCWFTHK